MVFNGQDVAGWETAPHRAARLGYVPEERRIFADLTVMENLRVGRRPPRDGVPALDRRSGCSRCSPISAHMRDRPGARMSGGEQQMLTIARTLMGNPRLILLDEPSEGLAPVIVEQMAEAVIALKAEGVTMLLAEQNLHFAARVADRAAVIESGRIVWDGMMAGLMADEAPRAAHLQV